MDDNQIATSEEVEVQDHIAVEVPDEPVAERKPGEAEDPESRREALAKAFAEAEKGEKADKPAPEEKAAAPEPEPKAQEKAAVPTPEEQAPTEQPKVSKAPQSWKPEARELFEQVPDAVKQEILRREQDINTTLAKTADERKIAQAYMQTAQNYEQLYRSRGMNSLQAVARLFEADRVLMTGTKEQRAAAAAQIITQYGVDLTELDNNLAQAIAQPKPQGPSQSEIALQQRLAQLEQHTYAQQQQAVAQQQQALNKTIDDFANDPKNEFFRDVSQHMVALLQGGTATTLQDAYDQACHANPSVRKVLSQREQANRQRAAAGTTSLPNKGPRNAPRPAQPVIKDRREALEAAFAAHTAGGRV